MPELPEVETIRRGLDQNIRGARIVRVHESGARLRGGSPRPLQELVGRTVQRVDRQAKFLLLGLDDGATLLLHLGMSGKVLLTTHDSPERVHTHVRLELDDGRRLEFVDPRRFGTVRLHPPGGHPPELSHYGIDALDPALDAAALERMLKGSRAPLKSFLLDQTKIAGLGNIYALEALWRAGLSPRRIAKNTPKGRIPLLLESIRGVLMESLANKGTSFNDYVDTLGDPGTNIGFLAVFQRTGMPCPRCATPVRRIVQTGRSSFYCPGCQR